MWMDEECCIVVILLKNDDEGHRDRRHLFKERESVDESRQTEYVVDRASILFIGSLHLLGH